MRCRESGPKTTERQATAFAHSMAGCPIACSHEDPGALASTPHRSSWWGSTRNGIRRAGVRRSRPPIRAWTIRRLRLTMQGTSTSMPWLSSTAYSKRRCGGAWTNRALGWMPSPSSGGSKTADLHHPYTPQPGSVGTCPEHDSLRPARHREDVAHRHARGGGRRESGSGCGGAGGTRHCEAPVRRAPRRRMDRDGDVPPEHDLRRLRSTRSTAATSPGSSVS